MRLFLSQAIAGVRWRVLFRTKLGKTARFGARKEMVLGGARKEAVRDGPWKRGGWGRIAFSVSPPQGIGL